MPLQEQIILKRILRELRSEKELSRINWLKLRELFGKRFTQAWELVSRRRIKKYFFKSSEREIWIAIGNNSEYLMYPNSGYCSCSDFYFRVINKEVTLCYHLLAQKFAESLDFYDLIFEEDEVYRDLINIWKNYALKN
jgi:predicted nucleic acid-binding Zn finger protein